MTRAEDVTETPAGEDRRYYHPVQKDWATFLETSEETGGEHTLIEVELRSPRGCRFPGARGRSKGKMPTTSTIRRKGSP